jgi:tRNA(Ile2) C34 agmatinyltransferase TiaS
MNLYIGLDDTDNAGSRGTGRLARNIAGALAVDYPLIGVTRHQLLVDPLIPYTSHNSSAALRFTVSEGIDLANIQARVHALMLADFQPGSDPGLCVAVDPIPGAVSEFGRRAQQAVLTQAEARRVAAEAGLMLEGLGGTEGGVIGALAAVGLAATGEDGRYLLVGRARDLSGLQPVEAVLAAGIHAVTTLDGQRVEDGLVLADKLRPAQRHGEPVQFVEWRETYWEPLKLD